MDTEQPVPYSCRRTPGFLMLFLRNILYICMVNQIKIQEIKQGKADQKPHSPLKHQMRCPQSEG